MMVAAEERKLDVVLGDERASTPGADEAEVARPGVLKTLEASLDDVKNVVTQANEERVEARDRLFSVVIRRGMITMAVGLVLQMITYVTSNVHINGVLLGCASLLQAAGIIMVSTVPIANFSMNTFMWRHNKTAAGLLVAAALIHAMSVLFHRDKLGTLIASGLGMVVLLHYPLARACVSRQPKHGWFSSTVSLGFFVAYLFSRGPRLMFNADCHAGRRLPECTPVTNTTPSGNDATNATSTYLSCTCVGHLSRLVPDPDLGTGMFWAGVVQLVGGLALVVLDLVQRWRWSQNDTRGLVGARRRGASVDLIFYQVLYGMFVVMGLSLVAESLPFCMRAHRWAQDGTYPGYLEEAVFILFEAAGRLVPMLVVLLFGRRVLFRILARKFDRTRAMVDGAIMASLLDGVPVALGQPWWLHTANEKDSNAGTWIKGVVAEIDEEKGRFGVSTFPSTTAGPAKGIVARGKMHRRKSTAPTGINAALTWLPLPTAATRDADGDDPDVAVTVDVNQQDAAVAIILRKATAALRYLDGAFLTEALMTSGSGQDDVSKSTIASGVHPPDKGELVDYFMSHSWHDDPKAKWAALAAHSESFRKGKNRYPTYWLDKVCIDQNNIADGLRVLAVNVMACRKVLIVCGSTYVHRLWCVLELFIMFAFSDEEDALNRVEIVPIEDDDGEAVLQSLTEFRIDEAHCYDPNEEARLRGVMRAVGEAKFTERIRALGRKLLAAKSTLTLRQQSFKQRIVRATSSGSSSPKTPTRLVPL